MVEQRIRTLSFQTFLIGLASACLLLPLTVYANQTPEDITDALQPYPRADVVFSESDDVVDYLIGLGPVRKVRGIWAPEKERRMEGELVRNTQQIPEGHGSREVFQYYWRRLNNIEARVIYRCDGRNCGPSNSWANDVFNVKQLYGDDGDQYYAVFELADTDEHLEYAVIYTVTRGNKRVFAHTELIKTKNVVSEAVAPDSKVIIDQFKEPGFFVVSGLSLDNGKLSINQEHLQALVSALSTERFLKVRVVGHDYSSGSLQEQTDKSKSYAEQLITQLTEQGIAKDRLEAHGAGSLAPMRQRLGSSQSVSADKTQFRLEIVPVAR